MTSSLIPQILLFVHIAAGGFAFISSPVAIIAKKGGPLHIKAGLVFSYCMYAVCMSSFALSFIKQNIFLFIIGIFSFYLVFTANRILNMKKFKAGDAVAWQDWMVSLIMMFAGAVFAGWGIRSILHQNLMGIVMLIFGVIGFLNASADIQLFRKGPTQKNFWLLIHIGRMLGATTAAYTAFLVVNARYFPFFPPWVVWLLPNIVFVPLSIYFTRREKRKSSPVLQ